MRKEKFVYDSIIFILYNNTVAVKKEIQTLIVLKSS